MIKVLWFSNVPVSAGLLKNKSATGGSWIKALEKAFRNKPGYGLGIVCQMSTEKMEKHQIENVDYFICPISSGLEKRSIGWGGNYILRDKEAVATYLQIIDEFQPDIIQIFGSENNYGLIIPHTKVPVIIHIQGFIAMYAKKYFSGILLSEMKKYTSTYKILKGVTEINYYHYFKKLEAREAKILSATTYFFGRTDWDRHIVKTLGPHTRYFHCDEMIREEFFSKIWEQPKHSTLVLSSILSAAPYKGFDLIYETAEKLINLKKSFIWNIIGSDSNEEIVRLLTRKYKKSYPTQIKLRGNKNTSELIEILLQSHVYVHPSYIDNSPNSVCEAMMLGMPVVVVSTGGTSSLIDHRVNGILVNAGDPYDMTGTLLDIIENPSKTIQMGKLARTSSLQRHHPEKIMETLTTTYNIIIHENK